MQVGKLYKSINNDLVVKCTGVNTNQLLFEGYVVEKGQYRYDVGATSDNWRCASFKEYNPIEELTIEYPYDIPSGCRAEVIDGTITIKKNVRYYKYKTSSFTLYNITHLDEQTNIYIYNDGDIYINNIAVQVGEECTEKEFQEAQDKVFKKAKIK